ncbi:hypothetical protein CLV59_101527 [Chitinophaga dinghuensis]|uniref:Uncharacterized protein n=1 Tax=Chitinophaga dinghuensis TaxID=1539050 RepID=A0A327WED1_9BACT|nr:hypothetical protein CLV59_101527 [Chitinophaga dinghuensis]
MNVCDVHILLLFLSVVPAQWAGTTDKRFYMITGYNKIAWQKARHCFEILFST